MSDRAALTVRIDASYAKLQQDLAKVGVLVQTSTKSMEKLSHSLQGGPIVSQATKITAVIQSMGGASELTAKQAQRMLAQMSEGIAKLEAMGKGVPESMRQTQQALKAVAGQADRAATSFGSAWTTAKGFLGAIGIQFGISQLASFGRSIFDTADKIVDLSSKMGVSIEAAQRFRYAARQAGADIEDVTTAVVKLSANLAVGDTSTASALASVGLQLHSVLALKPEDAFRTVADAIGGMADPMGQARVAMELFGKSGASLLPMIREQSLKAADDIRVMSDETVRRLEAAKQAWDNLWDSMTILGGEAIASISAGIRRLIEDVRSAAVFLAALATTKNIHTALQLGLADHIGRTSQSPPRPTAPADDLTQPTEWFRQQQAKYAAEQKTRAEAAAAAAKQHRARIDELKASMLGLSKASRDQAQALSELIAEGKTWVATALIPIADRTKDIIRDNGLLTKTVLAVGESYRTAAERVKAMYYEMGRIADWKTIFSGAMSVEQLSKGVVPSGPSLRDRVRDQLQSAASAFPTMLSQAIINGQSIAQAMRASLVTIGGDLGKSWGEGLAKEGGKLSKGLGSLFSAGASIGLDFLAKGVGALINKFKNVTKEGREGLAGQLGFESLDALYKRLQAMGPEGQRLANLGLNVIGKQDKAANEKWMKDVQAFFAKQTADADRLTAAMEKYGFSWEQLGQKARNAKVKDIADDLMETFRVLTDPQLGGIASDDVLGKMAGDFSSLVQAARRTGVEIPAAMRPSLERLRDMGLLLDENGELIRDLDSLKFAQTLTQGFDRVVDAIYGLTSALTGVPRALEPSMDALNGFGGMGRSVAGHEAPLAYGPGRGGPIVVENRVYLDGRQVAYALAPHQSEAAAFYGVG